jgi:hypothetical protein
MLALYMSTCDTPSAGRATTHAPPPHFNALQRLSERNKLFTR